MHKNFTLESHFQLLDDFCERMEISVFMKFDAQDEYNLPLFGCCCCWFGVCFCHQQNFKDLFCCIEYA